MDSLIYIAWFICSVISLFWFAFDDDAPKGVMWDSPEAYVSKALFWCIMTPFYVLMCRLWIGPEYKWGAN